MLNKWCLNFLILLLPHANGQRTQVYTSLKKPNEDELDDFASRLTDGREKLVLQLTIDEPEKRQRDVFLRTILLPSKVFKYVELQTVYVLPLLHKRFGIGSGDARHDALLLHTATGQKINTNNIRSSLHRFCSTIDAQLHITPTNLRASYATYMVRKYVRGVEKGRFMHGQNPENFMKMLAMVMNTSVEMIQQVYASATKLEYTEIVGGMLGLIEEDKGAALRKIIEKNTCELRRV